MNTSDKPVDSLAPRSFQVTLVWNSIQFFGANTCNMVEFFTNSQQYKNAINTNFIFAVSFKNNKTILLSSFYTYCYLISHLLTSHSP